jgi:DNA-directed RNA polymerase subunit M/transcription elongation factor TFIIS
MTFTRAECPNCGASNVLWEQIEEGDELMEILFAVDCDTCNNGNHKGPQTVTGETATDYLESL